MIKVIQNAHEIWLRDLQQSINAQPLQDEIYNQVFNAKNIRRVDFDKNDNHDQILDKEYHIDTFIELEEGQITLQEKALSHKFAKYNTFTTEYYQDTRDGTKGEIFSLTAQYYFSGYLSENQSHFIKWIIVDIPRFIMLWNNIEFKRLGKFKTNTAASSYASFIYIKYNDIPSDVIFARG